MPRVGNIIDGKYRLLEVIGEGSMGAVWKATHETLARPFAVKFLKDYYDQSARLQERFLTEARISAAVRHRNIIDVLDVGTTAEGTPYMVMEYLEGESLAVRLERDPPLPVRELLRLAIQALAGLEAVHHAGILHRDLKPENIVLCPGEGELVPKLVDFGISLIMEAGGETRRLTVPGTTLGTPWYMAPEQVQALPSMNERGDIYSFAVVLYEALTGQLPFEHDNIQMLLMMVAAGGAPPLHTKRPDLPRALSDVIDRAMAVAPEVRFDSASALAAALREVLPTVPEAANCQRRGQPLRPSELGPAVITPPAPTSRASASRNPTLPMALARLGLPRMPARSVLIGGGALTLSAALALVAYLQFGTPTATAEVQRGGAQAAKTGPRPPAGQPQRPLVVPLRTGGGHNNVATMANTVEARGPALERAAGDDRLPAPEAAVTAKPDNNLEADEQTPPAAQTRSRRARRAPPAVFRDPGF